MVYFIEAVGAGLVKIGFTDGDPNERLKQLQTGSGHPLRLRAVMEGDSAAERAHHQRFAHLRESGEWFRLTVELEVYVGFARWVQPRLVAVELRLNEIERAITDINTNASASYDNIEEAMGSILGMRIEIRRLKNDGILAAFGGE